MLIGIGIDAIFFILPYLVPTMPNWLTYSGLALGVIFIVFGLIMFVFPSQEKDSSREIRKDHNKAGIEKKKEIHPIIEYFLKQQGNEIYLYVKSSPKEHNIDLTLQYLVPEIRSLVRKEERSEVQGQFLLFERTEFYHQEIQPGSLIKIPVPIAEIENGNFFLIIVYQSKHFPLPIPPGIYEYRFHADEIQDGKNYGGRRKIRFQVTKEGKYIYNQEN